MDIQVSNLSLILDAPQLWSLCNSPFTLLFSFFQLRPNSVPEVDAASPQDISVWKEKDLLRLCLLILLRRHFLHLAALEKSKSKINYFLCNG
jgi:hypothetical protein